MVKNWSKIVLVSMLVVFFATSMAYASTSRVRTLANMGDYISDDSNVFRWYSTLPSYANMVQAELGQDYWAYDTRALSLNYSCGDEGKYGTWRISLLENAVDHPGLYSANPFIQMHSPGNATWGIPSGELPPPSTYPSGYVNTPINKFDIGWGYDVNENLAIGVAFTYSSWTYESTREYTSADDNPPGDQTLTEDTKLDNKFMTLGAGATWTNNDNLLTDVQFTLGFPSVEGTMNRRDEVINSDTTSTARALEHDNSMAIDVAGRLFYDWKEGVKVVPVVEFSTSEYNLASAQNRMADQYGPNAIEYETFDGGLKTTHLQVGVGLDIDVNQDNTLLFALEYSQTKYEYTRTDMDYDTWGVGLYGWDKETIEGEWKTKDMPTFRLALESAINSWLTTRIGAAKSLAKVTDEWTWIYDPANPATDNESDTGSEEYTSGAGDAIAGLNPGFYGSNDFSWFLGAGFNIAEWTIDMELDSRTPFSIGYWLTGYTSFDGESDGPVLRISGSYNF